MKTIQRLLGFTFLSLVLPGLIFGNGKALAESPAGEAAADRLPNIVIIFIDDLGYSDIGPFGAKGYETPNLDQMAKSGRRFTDFVASSAVCSSSRASLLTGCYNRRLGISGAFGPKAKAGLHPNEVTIAELCKQKDYATACYGKWHLGLERKFLPLQQGFDEYYGLPYSNDMWPYHPNFVDLPADSPKRKNNYPPLPLIEGNKVIDAEVNGEDQKQLTTAYTERAVSFINRHANKKPFFLYVPHSMVHVPLYVSDKFAGKSGAGLFGDVMLEVDWSVGQILGALKKNNIDDNTLVIFTSDNGPWLSYGDHAGSAAPLREGKGTMWEGGYRVPTIAHWSGRIKPDTTCEELCSTIDLFPTIAKLIGGQLPDHKIDGKDISNLLFTESGKSPHTHFACYYSGGQLQAIRDRQYKLVFPHRYRSMNGRPGGTGGKPNAYQQLKATYALYDLKADVGETTDVAKQHPEVVARLEKYAQEVRDDLGDKLTKTKGSGARPIGRAN